MLSPTVDCASELVTEIRACFLPPQVHEQDSQPKSRESPADRNWIFLHFFLIPVLGVSLVRKQSHTSTTFCLFLFLLSLCRRGSLPSMPISCTYGPASCLCGPLEMCLSVCNLNSWNSKSSGLNTTGSVGQGNFRSPYFSTMLTTFLISVL